VRPTVERGATFALHQAGKYEEAGYRAAREAIALWRGVPPN
jgi:hypothetical protein